MTVEECYTAIGGNYKEISGRLLNDAFITNFLSKFLADDNFNRLCKAIEQNDYKAAFDAAHALKGVSANMAFTNLTVAVSELTEDLREYQGSSETRSLFETVKLCYADVQKAIVELQKS